MTRRVASILVSAGILVLASGCGSTPSAPTTSSSTTVAPDGATTPAAPEVAWNNPTVPLSGCGISVIRWFVDDSLRAALRSGHEMEFMDHDELLATLAAPPPPADEDDDGAAPKDGTAPNADDAASDENARRYRVAIENEVFRPAVADVVRTSAEWRPDDAQRFAALRRNGIAVARIPVAKMPALIAELGDVQRAVRSWQGQAPDWRDLSTRTNDGQVRGVAINGHVRRYVGGSFKLQFRGWLMPMEDGPRMQFELRGAFAERVAPQAFRQNATERITAFDGAHTETLLEPGYVYVLAAIRPGEVWHPDDAAGTTPEVGPRASMPLRLGPLLLDGAEHGIVRELILIEPCVPAALMPAAPESVARAPESAAHE